MKLVIINGSPRGKNSNSNVIVNETICANQRYVENESSFNTDIKICS